MLKKRESDILLKAAALKEIICLDGTRVGQDFTLTLWLSSNEKTILAGTTGVIDETTVKPIAYKIFAPRIKEGLEAYRKALQEIIDAPMAGPFPERINKDVL